MKNKNLKSARSVILLLVLFLAAQACAMTASAEDAKLLAMLPGEWTCSEQVEVTDQEMQQADAVLTLREDGTMSLSCSYSGNYAFSYGGTWSSELVTEASDETGTNDKLILNFTSTDNPLHAGSAYSVECLYYIYSEGWMENDAHITALILEMPVCSGVSPIEEIFGYDSVALQRVEGPNMRVVNCKDYVSLRAKRSSSSTRLAKVPLGALVYADPEVKEQSGFLFCTYQGKEGFILAEYLEPVD